VCALRRLVLMIQALNFWPARGGIPSPPYRSAEPGSAQSGLRLGRYIGLWLSLVCREGLHENARPPPLPAP
jgi:hypothetical protein